MQGGKFEDASVSQLVIIETYLTYAGTTALDRLMDWVDGKYEPDCISRPPIEWFIHWLDNQEMYERYTR